MPDKTLTINHADGGSETYTINRDKFEGIRNMTVDGATVSVDHTPADDLRNLLVDAENVTIDRAHGGEIRTLFIDGVEVTIDRTGEVIVEGFLTLFPNAAAAYSLQRLNGHQALINARRGSDNAEVDVYPDSSANREVSADSPITVTSGSSSATTFGEFLTEDVTLYQPDYSTSSGLLFPSNLNLYANQDGVGGKDDALKLEVVSTGTNTVHRAYQTVNSSGGGTDSITVSYEIFVPSGSASQEKLGIALEYTSVNKPAADFPSALDTWETVTHTFDGGINTRLYIGIASVGGSGTNNAKFVGTTGDHVYIRNFKVEQTHHGAFVTTWYDQSGNDNHASQTLDDAQPKIAENGSVLADGIKFDGVDDQLSVSDPVITASFSGAYSGFSVQNVATTEKGYLYGCASPDNGTSLYAKRTEFDDVVSYALSNTNAVQFDYISRAGAENLLSFCYNNGDAGMLVNGGGTMTDAGTYDFATGTGDFIIGNRNEGSSAGTYLDGAIKEIIIYNSDQSAKRTDIEAHINGRYSIY